LPVKGALAEAALADDPLAERMLAGEAPVGPALIVSTTGALGRASVPAEGSVPVTVPYSSGPWYGPGGGHAVAAGLGEGSDGLF
jgi:hypothetical protein